MRNKPILTILVLAILISVIGCSKHDPPKSSESIYKGSISAKVNGSEWKASESSQHANYSKDPEWNPRGKLLLIGGSADGKSILISIYDMATDFWNDSIAAKTYNYRASPRSEATISYQDGSSTSYFPYDCEATITSIDPTNRIISGTFTSSSYSSGNYKDTIRITDGVFKDIKYIIRNKEE